jgi:hypothetical protein
VATLLIIVSGRRHRKNKATKAPLEGEPIPSEAPFLEYIGNVYGVAEDWWSLQKIYHSLKSLCSKCEESAETLLRHAPNEIVRRDIRNQAVPTFSKSGLVGTIKEYLPGGKQKEWPDPQSKLSSNCELARTLLESKQWNSLEKLLLDEIMTDGQYENFVLPKRIVIASGLALLDFKNKYPNCVAPWKTLEKGGQRLSIKNKAKLIEIVLKMRARKITLSSPQNACKEIGIVKDMSTCVRVLVAGGYSRTDELFYHVKNDDDLTVIAGCFYLETRGPKEAVRYYGSRPYPENGQVREFVDAIRTELAFLKGWHSSAKTLSMACPCRDTELPIHHRVRRSDLVSNETKSDIKNIEKLFWVLCAAQYKEMAREMYRRLEGLLEPILPNLKKSTSAKVKAVFERMEDSWLKTDIVDLTHIASQRLHVDIAIAALTKGNIPAAEEARKTVLANVRQHSTGRAEQDPSVKFMTLLITAFRNPQILVPNSVTLLRPDDWLFNWYVTQAVDQYASGQNRVELIDNTVEPAIFDLQQSFILFFAGRYSDVLALGERFELPEDIERYAKLCSIRRKDVCAKPLILEGDDEPAELSHSIPPRLCEAIEKSKTVKAVRDSTFTMTPVGMELMTILGGESYLQPALPSEAPLVPLDAIQEARIIAPPLTLDLKKTAKLAKKRKILFELVDLPAPHRPLKLSAEAKNFKLEEAVQVLIRMLNRIERKEHTVRLSKKQLGSLLLVREDLPTLGLSLSLGESETIGNFFKEASQCDRFEFDSFTFKHKDRQVVQKILCNAAKKIASNIAKGKEKEERRKKKKKMERKNQHNLR